MRRQVLIGVAGIFLATFIIAGCRYRSAGEDRQPTPPGEIALVDLQTPQTPDFAATETSAVLTLQAQTPSSTPTASESPTVWTSIGVETTALPTFTATATFSQPVQFPTATATPTTPVVAAVLPSATPTSLPSATSTATSTVTSTATSTNVPPTATSTPSTTPTNTLPPFPTNTPTSQITATFTPFPTLTLTIAPTVIGQGGGSELQATLLPQQMTATAIIFNATATAAAAQGTQLAITPQVPIGTTPGAGGVTGQTTPSSQFPDCDYLIQPGDKLGVIARTYNVALATLASYNNITNWDYIKAGDTIKIPGCGRNATPTPTGTPAPSGGVAGGATPDNSLGPVQYVVVGGDNIYKLSVRFCVTMRDIVVANPRITNINIIIAGDTLTIPARTLPCGTATPTPTLQVQGATG
ncbi:MAG: LysM peptidoglycan-binding domain-containing protein [Chloroflexi bacterium]|nr:LysM peptidoglycan-binding domain-containing protein [Chloroflexota bacterium]